MTAVRLAPGLKTRPTYAWVNVKQAVRDRLSPSQISHLRRVREALRPTAWSMRLAGMLPTSHAVAMKEGIHRTGRLDYAGAAIRLELGSRMEVSRLHACAKEPETVRWLETELRPGDVFYDIGANVGAYSFIANALLHGRGRIYAFEASFSTFASLSQNVFLNNGTRVIVPLHVALSSRTGLLELRHHDLRAGAAEHLLAPIGDGAGSHAQYAQPVLGYRLDDFVQQFRLEPPAAIKLDVDGVELDVLEGAADTLRSPLLRTILVEIDERRYPDEQIPRLLQAAGFKSVSRHQRGLNPLLANYVFVRTASL